MRPHWQARQEMARPRIASEHARGRLGKGEIPRHAKGEHVPTGVGERDTRLVLESGRSIARGAVDSPGVRHSEHPLAR